MLKFFFLFALSLSSLKAQNKMIYGTDNRKDLFEVKSSLIVELARSTAAMIPNSSIINSIKGTISIVGKTLSQRGICSSERFSNQLAAANCSGFIVSENTLITAGHCMRTALDCSQFKWVFDYAIDVPGQQSFSVQKDDVFSCKRIIKQVLDSTTMNDYAVIELDRPVQGRRPLSFRKAGKVTIGTPLFVIGHPSGLPTKIADGATVRLVNSTYLRTDLDTYGGNSGSAVFNAKTLKVEGILVRGDNDYIPSPKGCMQSNIVAQNLGRGEDVTRITNIKIINKL